MSSNDAPVLLAASGIHWSQGLRADDSFKTAYLAAHAVEPQIGRRRLKIKAADQIWSCSSTEALEAQALSLRVRQC